MTHMRWPHGQRVECSFFCLDVHPVPSMGARTKTWAEVTVRKTPTLCEQEHWQPQFVLLSALSEPLLLHHSNGTFRVAMSKHSANSQVVEWLKKTSFTQDTRGLHKNEYLQHRVLQNWQTQTPTRTWTHANARTHTNAQCHTRRHTHEDMHSLVLTLMSLSQ